MGNYNRDLMFKKYPDLKDELIRDTSQFEKEATHIFENPDMNCCQLIISLGMFLISVYVFYFYRDFNSEYYNRQLISLKLDSNPYGYQNFSNITDENDLYLFLTKTVAFQIFPTE